MNIIKRQSNLIRFVVLLIVLLYRYQLPGAASNINFSKQLSAISDIIRIVYLDKHLRLRDAELRSVSLFMYQLLLTKNVVLIKLLCYDEIWQNLSKLTKRYLLIIWYIDYNKMLLTSNTMSVFVQKANTKKYFQNTIFYDNVKIIHQFDAYAKCPK